MPDNPIEDALRMLVSCFDESGNIRETYRDKLPVILEQARTALTNAQEIRFNPIRITAGRP